ncbi:MAG: bifunctional aspartate kinase/homoserine dehydrogenase I [Rubricoccaceae bacterium]|nr:bifunctional aspartate kinase/homoserine dehydrogenase I [Rubricoccaceae bacterium]
MPEPARPVHVAKFGGTSVGTPERVQRVVALSAETPARYRRIVVASAFGGVTDQLLAALQAAEARTDEHRPILDALRRRHRDALDALAPEAERAALWGELEAAFGETRELLDGVSLLRECTPRVHDAVVSLGERASAPLVAAAFRDAGHAAVALDARAFIRTDDAFGEAAVDFEATRALAREAVAAVPADAFAVVTGFIATTEAGVTTTLGRSGSDYTATILAGALDAEACVIWTDVDGVLSADPRLVPEAFTLPRLSYEEAAELAHFGAKVLHPRTMRPLQPAGIPLVIKNTLRPEHPGTRIGPERGAGGIHAVTAARGAALVRFEGAGVLGVPDLAARLFDVLADAGVEVLLVAQASSEGSLCLVVKEAVAEEAERRLRKAFARERERGDLRGITVEPGQAVVAAVGDFVREAPGLAGRMFATLGRAHVNCHAIAQSGGEHNLSAVVADADAPVAVRALHEAFALRRLRAHVFVIGAGTLGRRLLDLLAQQAAPLREGHRLNLQLVGVATSGRQVFDEAGLPPAEALAQLSSGADGTLEALVDRLVAARLERLIVVDATPSAAVARRHADLLRAGIAVVTPNKAATMADAAAWQAAQAAAAEGEAPYLYETTVGAGLGVVAALRDLLRTGDAIRRIEGVLSGTLAFVFNRMREGAAFSEAVREAQARGLTEPDPRDDLSGRDVARKLALLAREIARFPQGRGLAADPADAAVESLVPEPLREVPREAFLRRLPEHDAAWRDRLAAAEGQLQYVARLGEDGRIRAGVEAVAPGSPLGDLRGPSLVVAFHTARYAPEPLVIQGPGANADVTAAVLLADIVRAAEAMR